MYVTVQSVWFALLAGLVLLLVYRVLVLSAQLEKTMINETTQTSVKKLVSSPKSLDELQLFTMPEGGTDRLNFITWDTIEVIGQGEEVIEFHGSYTIERANPTSADWAEASVDITMRDLSLEGVSSYVGPVRASVNPDPGKVSGGQVRPGTTYAAPDSPKLCQMYGYVQFELVNLGMTVFNKEPILLEHNITHIPPVGQGGGTKERVDIALFRKDAPDSAPVAILHRVKTHIGGWLTETN
jgi:hypothetical protein